jgi:hypothetical protein
MIKTSKHPLFKAAFLKIYCIEIIIMRNLWIYILINHFWYLLLCYDTIVIWCINLLLSGLLNCKTCWSTQPYLYAGMLHKIKNWLYSQNITFSTLHLKCSKASKIFRFIYNQIDPPPKSVGLLTNNSPAIEKKIVITWNVYSSLLAVLCWFTKLRTLQKCLCLPYPTS